MIVGSRRIGVVFLALAAAGCQARAASGTPSACHRRPVAVSVWSGGRERIVRVPPPIGLGRGVIVTGLSALTSRDVWAVGNRGALVGTYALAGGSVIAHWDGTRWRLMAHPQKPQNALVAVLAISPRDVWAVGAYQGSIPPGVSVAKTLTEHWDGTRWRIVRSPNSRGSGQLQTIVALAPNDIWSAGGSHSAARTFQTARSSNTGTGAHGRSGPAPSVGASDTPATSQLNPQPACR
jgi:hypothetical protein